MSISNEKHIYYKKYIKYKMKYLNLLLMLKNNAKVAIESSDFDNNNNLDKIKQNTVKNKPGNHNHNDKHNDENSDKTVMSIDFIDSNESTLVNNYKPRQLSEDPSIDRVLNKFKSIKNKLNDEEYNKLLSEISTKFSEKTSENYMQNFNIDEIIYIKKLNRIEKNILNSITEPELNILKKYNCGLIKNKIFDAIENKTCTDDKILDIIWKNLVIIDEELKCGLDENETIKFNQYLEKPSCQ